MQNHYQVLGVSVGATPEVLRIAFEGRLKALAKARLGEPERKAEEAALRLAYGTLTNPARRAAFDAQLEGAGEREARSSRNTTIAVVAAVLVAVVAGLGWYFSERGARAERIRLEEARIAREAEELRYRVATEKADKERREREAAYAQESAARREERDRQRVERERTQYQREVDRAQSVADREAERARSEEEARERERERAELRDKAQAERDLAAAQRDANRQKRYLEQQEEEERRIREERHQRAVLDSEEARKRELEAARAAREAERARQREEQANRPIYYPPAVKR